MSGFLKHSCFFLFLICSFIFDLHAQDTLQAQSNRLKQLSNNALQEALTQPQEAVKSYQEALQIAQQLHDASATNDILLHLGKLYSEGGNYTLSREKLQQVYQQTIAKTLPSQHAQAAFLIAKSYQAQGNPSGAIQYFLDALKYFESVQETNGMISCYAALSEVYARLNMFSKSIDYNLKALSLAQHKQDRFRQINVLENLGSIYLSRRDLAKAEQYYLLALKVYQEMNNKAGEANALQQLGDISYDQSNFTKANAYYTQSYLISKKLDAKALQAENLNGMASVNMEMKNFSAASDQYRNAMLLAKEAGLSLELDEAYKGLAMVYQAMKDQTRSKTFQALSAHVNDSVYNDSILRRISDLQLLNETEKKQAEIELLKKNDELNEISLKKERQKGTFLTALSVLLCALIFVFAYFITQNRKINRALKQQFADVQQKNLAIEEQKEKLKQLGDVKDRFFSIISHDLRNNLTTMKVYFDLVSIPGYQLEQQQQVTKDISASVQNTIELFENLLIWASAQVKGLTLHATELNIYELAAENIALLQTAAAQKKIELSNEVDEQSCACADKQVVNLVLRNLLSNAIKFTGEGGRVNVLSEEEEGYLKILVIDNGVGINQEKLKDLFTRYEQISTLGTANEKGTGLGLMLCKDFIEQSGGQIWVESEEGKGTCFIFTLPLFPAKS